MPRHPDHPGSKPDAPKNRTEQLVEAFTLQMRETYVLLGKSMIPLMEDKPEDIDTYGYAVDDHHPWFFENSPFGGKIGPPTLLANQALFMRHCRYLISAGLHAKMQFEFIEPLRPGMRVRSYGKVIDKYERRERHYMTDQYWGAQ